MQVLYSILLSTFIVSLFSLVGVFTFFLKERMLDKVLLILVSLSAGALIGDAFIHLIPEASEKFQGHNVFIFVLAGFVLFFLVERILHWRHCHEGKCDIHTFAYMNFLGDVIHNFIDGLIIAASFVADFRLGVVTSFAIALHEIPQEFGDFAVLVYGGFKKSKALFWNFLCAISAIAGGLLGYFISSYVEGYVAFLLPIAAGGFVYISASDLIPEIRKETRVKASLLSFGIFVLGILITYLTKFVGE